MINKEKIETIIAEKGFSDYKWINPEDYKDYEKLTLLFLEEEDIQYRKNSNGVEDKDANEPYQLVVSSRLPKPDSLPDCFPDYDHNQKNIK